MRKVRASQDRITANGSRRRLQGKCNREIPPGVSPVRVERRGKSSPEQGEPCCHVNPIRCNTSWEAITGPVLPKGGLSGAAMRRRDRLSHTTELGL